MSFTLDPTELETPEGFQGACRKARIYVEANVPGQHAPHGRAFWHSDPDGLLIGCCCAVGFLAAALAGSIQRAATGRLNDFGLTDDDHRRAFQAGFDEGYGYYPYDAEEGREHPVWREAGRALATEWRNPQ